MFFNDWLNRRKCYTPHRLAVVDDSTGREFTYEDMERRASQLAVQLREAIGVQPRDRVACLATNCLEYLDLYFACGKLGAILVPINTRLPATQVQELLGDCQPKLLLYGEAFAEPAAMAEHTVTGLRTLPIDRALGTTTDNRMVQAPPADEHDVAMILYTSGTTGRAKGAMITWRQIHWNALHTIIGLQLTEQDAAFLNMPLYHTGGWHVLFTPLMLVGGRVILQTHFDAYQCNDRVGPAGVSILFGVPTMLRRMCEVDNFEVADLSHVRFAICGGEPCPLSIIEAYGSRGVAVRQGYGLTEAGPNCFSLPAQDAFRKQGSIGFPNFFIQARLVDKHGCEVPSGDVGELRMRGPHLFAGYWNNEQQTREALQDGWLATGDLMMRDDEGYYFVVGRTKEMYISGGENVYPAQVERILLTHADVGLVAVIAMPHPRWGETGWLFAQPEEGRSLAAAELLAWSQRHLASFQRPARCVVMPKLPLGPSGKIDKQALRSIADATLAAAAANDSAGQLPFDTSVVEGNDQP